MHSQTKVRQSYLPEIKRYISYFSICLYYQKTISEDTQNTKDSLNKIYQDLLLPHNSDGHDGIPEIIKILVANIANHDLVSTIRKAAIKTLIKLFQFREIREELERQEGFELQDLIASILESKFDSVDQEEEEQIMLLIQKLILKVLSQFTINEDSIYKGIKYFVKVLKIRALEDQDSYNTVQFMDLTKRNFHKLLHFVTDLIELESLKERMLSKLFTQVKKAYTKLNKADSHNQRVIEYVIFMIKTVEDCIKKVDSDEELCRFIQNLKSLIIEVICVGGESEEIMIRNQSQQLFSLLLKIILDFKIPMREELELMFTKLVLKPVINQTRKMKQKEETSKINPSSIQEVEKKSNTEDDEIENEDFIQVTYERTVHEDILLEMSLNYLLETFLSLTTEQFGALFALYDCQPFSENIVLKSLILVFKHSQNNPSQYLRQGLQLAEKFKQLDLSKGYINNYGPQGISYMLEQKATIRKLAKDINAKFKVGLQKIDDLYKYIDEQTPAEVASKILLFSRDIQIDKIAEILGGKDERAKKILCAYLEKLDYKEANIEQSLRKFLQTYRLAGVDSQVIMRILEQFSYKFHQYDYKNAFKTKEEAYEFAYLIIVLQTCQHNPSVKNKTDIKSFIESAQNICPKSMDSFPADFFEQIFNSVTKYPFFTPPSRSLLDENFNGYSLNEIDIRLSKIGKDSLSNPVTENEFINTSDLTQKQLYHYNNSVEVPETLLPQALKYVLNFITQRFLRFSMNQLTQQDKKQLQDNYKLLTTLVTLNKSFASNENVDKIFQVIFKVMKQSQDENLHSSLEGLLWENFDCIKKSLILIPKLSMSSFMRDEIKENVSDVFKATHRLITNQASAHTGKDSTKGKEETKSQKGQSLIDLVFNYFTDNNEEQKKVEKSEIETLTEVRKRMLLEDKEENYQEELEERFDDKTGQQWLKEQSRMHELITLVCSYIRDNLNQEEGILSLAFLDHLMSKSDSQETSEKLWVELHLLLTQSLKLRMDIDIPISGAKEEAKGDYEVISTDTSQDSIEAGAGKEEFDFFHKETCPIKTKLYSCMTRHLIVMLHIKISKQVMVYKTDSQHIVRDIQRVISLVIENSHDKTLDPLKTIDEHFMFQQLNHFTKPLQKTGQIHPTLLLRTYPKISKLLRLILILLLKGSSKKDETGGYSSYHQLSLLTNLTYYLVELAQTIPFDLITLSQDILTRYTLPVKHDNQEQLHENINNTYENLFSALLKTHTINDESIFDLWLKLVQLLQEKVIQHPSFKQSELQSMRTFSILKNTVLNQPFEIKVENYPFVKKLFENCLFWMTFESMNAEKRELEKMQGKDKDEQALRATFDEQLEQACIYSVNTLTDIFIYYIATIYGEQGLEGERLQSRQATFNFMWLNFLKVLLHYAEQSNAVGYHTLVQTVYENTKRIIEFLIHEQILVDDQENQENQKIWKFTWDLIGAFFTDLKATIINEGKGASK